MSPGGTPIAVILGISGYMIYDIGFWSTLFITYIPVIILVIYYRNK
tara:strand:- start:516 stop:653 length:138 start_codon:yes stop_codon:yes gene_type:complete